MFDITSYETRFKQSLERLESELKKIRTGRAHPSQLDSIKVEVYGTIMPLNQVANITAPEAQMLLVTPFDINNIKSITAAIRSDQSLGFNPSDDGRVIRVPVPALTEERRKMLAKQANEKVEEAKIALRGVRQDAFKDIKRRKDSKELSEDDARRFEKQIDERIGQLNGEAEDIFKIKEKEILTI